MANVVYEVIKGVPFISAKIFGRNKSFTGRFIVDTGSAMTIVRTSRIDALGFCAKDATNRFSTHSVIGREEGYRLILPCVEAFDEKIENIEIAALDLPPKYQMDGLIGMNILSLFEFTFHPEKLIISTKRLSNFK